MWTRSRWTSWSGTPWRIGAGISAILVVLAGSIGTTASLASSARHASGAVTQAASPINPSSVPLPKEKGGVSFHKATPGSGKGLKLGYISLGEQIPFAALVTKSIKAQAARAGASMTVCDSREQTPVTLQCAQAFKTKGIQGYLNFQSDSKASGSICSAGPSVPVIAIDIHQPPCEKAFMGANNSYGGLIAGLALGMYFKKNFNCKYDAFVSMEEPAAGVVNTQRMGGYRKGFKKYCGAIHDLSIQNASRIDIARTTFADVLTRLTGRHRIIVVAINDDAIEGSLAAARTAGRVNDLYVAGQGADPTAWCEIKTDKQWVADAAYFPERYGEIGVPYLIKLVKGQSVPKNLLVKHRLVNTLNISKIYNVSKCK